MKALLDTGVWWKWINKNPMRNSLRHFLEVDVSEFYLCPVSLAEVFYKIEHRGLPAPSFPGWKTRMVEGFRLAPLSFEAAELAGSWEWEHGDPCDRIISAVAKVEGLTLVHTDQVLKDLPGFPQRYFKNISPHSSG